MTGTNSLLNLFRSASSSTPCHGCDLVSWLNHLMFAYDVMIFCKAHPLTLQIISNSFKAFHKCAGLHANHDKSQMVFGGCSPHLQQQCLEITGFQEGTFPMRYLGVPIIASRLSKLECRALVDKIVAKIRLWSTRNISFAGRAQLLNIVIFGMFNFGLSSLSSHKR